MLGLFGRRRHERSGHALYTAAVQAARDPAYYTDLGVPDTLDGRFDLIGVHVFLVIDRLRDAGVDATSLNQAVFDAMFADMDFNLREMGVGDMTVGKRNREMWEAFHGRSLAYQAALDDPAGLAEALARNVWRGAAPPGAPERLASIMQGIRAGLAAQPLERFLTGAATFPATEAVAA